MNYQEIMEQLQSLPADTARVEREIVDIKKSIKDTEITLEKRQADIVVSREAKAWGSNEADRKVAQGQVFWNDSTCQRLHSALAADRYDLAVQEVELKRLQNTFYAVRSAAELQAAFLLVGRSVGSNVLAGMGV